MSDSVAPGNDLQAPSTQAELRLAQALADGLCDDPFAWLGPHPQPGGKLHRLRVHAPGAQSVTALAQQDGRELAALTPIGHSGLFVGDVALPSTGAYRLRIASPLGQRTIDDPYRFGHWLGDTDVWLLNEGRHLRPWEKLGAHKGAMDGVEGLAFAVWAPNARQVGLAGDFNLWNSRVHPMRFRRECGIWELFVPGLAEGALYKFDVLSADGSRVLKTDPYAFSCELPPGHAARAIDAPQVAPGPARQQANALAAPISIYEVHAGSWRRPGGAIPDWHFLADHLVPYVADMGFTHIELLPVSEHPFYASWGYQPTGLYAPSARYGDPASFRAFVDRAHAAGLQLILDWVPAHFPSDLHALARFDGTALYEHADPREGFHRDWNTLIYNWGRNEVRNFLVANALFWIERYGIDGLRVDAVASMLYRDYSREPGQWVPNKHGGRENLEAIDFLREVNRVIGEEAPGAAMMAEESTAFPGVTKPPWTGGLGFNYKWNMGWMHDTLSYFALDPVHRKHHHHKLSFMMMYAYSEHFILPLSHDEVVHGKGSLYGRMAGDAWQKRANLRALFGLMYAQPGRKLMFMGSEFGQHREWDHDSELDWGLLQDDGHAGLQRLVRDLNRLYRDKAALHARDDEPGGFSWVEVDDSTNSVYGFIRHGHEPQHRMLVACNLTPVPRHGYRLGVPTAGAWRECLNTDSAHYGGSGQGNAGRVQAEAIASHGLPASVSLTLPPLSVLWLEPDDQ
ncbi:MAG TPA: 1,4-alpha-glucan branching protein GlgB [Ramlibacter sp.]|nr:1,4-alpha-glucan branching protein GlgB [Ramlibacter sp.]